MARTLLLVDDDMTTRELLSLLLQNAGWRVTAAEDGAATLALLRLHPVPDLILSDLQMPGLCGTPLAKAIRSVTASPVLLAMTATLLPVVPEGYDALIVKPFPTEAVAEYYEAIRNRTQTAPRDTLSEARETAVLDPAVLQSLRQSMPPDRLHALLTLVADDADGRITRMGVAASLGDDSIYRKEAHALKGSCGMVGAFQLRQLAACAEDEGLPQGPLTEWKAACDFVAATAAIRLMLETLSPATPETLHLDSDPPHTA